MKRSVLICLVPVLLITLVLLTFFLGTHNEPSYKGRSLTSWLREFDDLKSDEAGVAWNAVDHIGTNCLPTLLKMVDSRDSKLKKFFVRALSRQSFAAVDLRSADQQHFEAQIAFRVLKSRARTAIPALSRSLRDADGDVGSCALKCLLAIGPEAHQVLDDACRDRSSSVREMAENALAILDSEDGAN